MSKPRIDFHILDQDEDNYYLYMARLVEKIYKQNHTVFIYTRSELQSKKIDELLWTFQDTSFLPHHIEAPESPEAPILINHKQPSYSPDVVINLSLDVPSFYKQSSRTIELVYADEDHKKNSREKYRQYQKEDCHIQTFHEASS